MPLQAYNGSKLPILVAASDNFRHFYYPYIVKEWRVHYISYDALKNRYQTLKKCKPSGISSFDNEFSFEIRRMDTFLEGMLFEIVVDLKCMERDWKNMNDAQRKEVTSDQEHRTLERALRSLYEKCKSCKSFHKLNAFLICKIAKKLEKLSPKSAKYDYDFEIWKSYRSHDLFSCFLGRSDSIDNLTNRCIDLYSSMFRQSYPSLAIGELDFVKNKELSRNRTRIHYGFKLGVVLMILIWLVADAYELGSGENFWISPGLFVYTAIGSMLLFKALWAINVWAWARFNVNYISLLRLSNLRPNSLQIMNDTADLFLLFFVNILLYCRAYTPDSKIYHSFFTYASPLTLILSAIVYQFYMKCTEGPYSRGLFNAKTLWNCIRAPWVTVSFRDNYSADVLTSFTKVISDSIYASCWVFSGCFLSQNKNATYAEFGSSTISCTSDKMMLITSCFVALPLWIRLLQCLRVAYDTQHIHPQIPNSIKYALSIVVVFYGIFRPVDSGYIFVITLTTLYKWWWDVVMDWGLLEGWGLSFSKGDGGSCFSDPDLPVFLRRSRLYPHTWLYYVAIVIDLLLRYIWVISLMPVSLGFFVGPTFKLFSGCLEIIRRAMWGHFRVEYEHIKFVRDKKPGFLDNRIVLSRENLQELSEDLDNEERGLLTVNASLSHPSSTSAQAHSSLTPIHPHWNETPLKTQDCEDISKNSSGQHKSVVDYDLLLDIHSEDEEEDEDEDEDEDEEEDQGSVE